MNAKIGKIPNTLPSIIFLAFLSFSISNAQNLEMVGSCKLNGSARFLAVENSIVFIGGENPFLRIVDVSDPANPVVICNYNSSAIPWNICSENRIVYLACGWDGIRIIDASIPESPFTAGVFDTTDFFHDVVVRKNVAYLLTCWHFYTIDISNISAPYALGDMGIFAGDAFNLYVEGNYAYTIDTYNQGMSILDVSIPAQPVPITHYEGINCGWDISVVQDYAFTTYSFYFQIVNVADPFNPY